ncbi:MAG: SpoIIE family protein phosphatase [Flavobacteriales bacterium]|nr:SpoIIE family protein phosphatase [Flavobacteriales bacterium]
MKIRLTIGRIISLGFGLIIVSYILINWQTLKTLDLSEQINSDIIEIHSPSVDALQELKILVLDSRFLIQHWYDIPVDSTPGKIRLIGLTEREWPKHRESIMKLSENWNDNETTKIDSVFESIDLLFAQYELIKLQLSQFSDYNEPENLVLAEIMLEPEGDIDLQMDDIKSRLDMLIKLQRDNTKRDTENMFSSFNALEFIVKLGFLLAIFGIVVAVFTARSIVKPVNSLKDQLLLLGKGIIPKDKMKITNNEIGDMSMALNDLLDGFNRTTIFAKEVGSGNFSSDYQPLSKEDTLGHSLLRMRQDLSSLTSNLEQKVLERTQKIEEQKKEIEVLLKHTTDSIIYAKRIQEAILPTKAYIERVLPNSFVLYRPKDIVSGDFYWVHENNEVVTFAAIDCTGHGVPGAFMTIIGHNGLNKAVQTTNDVNPAVILNSLNDELSSTFSRHGDSEIKDGMDAAMCTVDFKAKSLQFAGAFNPLYLVRDGEIVITKGDKFPVGEFIGDEKQKFTNHSLELQSGDTIYIFSDGYADQFGGPKGKKFMYKNFRKLLLEIQSLSMNDQKQRLNKEIELWMGDLEQVDDIVVIGLKVP